MYSKMTQIKAILFDIDGVLTNAQFTIDSSGGQSINFNVRDGQLLSFMRKNGYIFGAISGRDSACVRVRLESLGIDFVRLGVQNKLTSLHEFLEMHSLEAENVCFIGDDVIDLRVMDAVGLSAAPCDAVELAKERADFVTSSSGGHGVLREVIDLIINSRQDLQKLLAEHYGFKYRNA